MPFDGRTPPLAWPPCTPDVVTRVAWPPCTPDVVTRVARGRDPVRRNLEITQSYHQLTVALGARLGRRDLPWTGYAVWASKTAGSFIRGEWQPPRLRSRAERHGGALARMLRRVEAHVRAHVSEGNRRVYAEIAPLFVELLDVLDAPPSQRESRTAALLDRLRPGPVHRGGQDGLHRAARAYVDAAACPDRRRRAELILLGNLEIGYHEQWRLQGPIEGALQPAAAALPSARGPGRVVVDRAAARLRRPLTRLGMRLHVPGAVLRMSRDVPGLPDGRMFPADLERVREPALRRLLARIDRTPDTTRGSAARDWADFGDRMNYVADMFRAQQQMPTLWQPPFEATQVEALREGRVPAGPL